MYEFPNEYRELIKQVPTDEVANAITLDLTRTFPDNEYFRNMPGSLIDELKIVLTAFANKNPHIGYCQGLNYLAGMMLLILRNSEQTFWLLHCTISELPSYYCGGMQGLVCDMAVLNELLRQKAPDIHSHFRKIGFDPAMLVTKWFVCWYLETLPIETVLRIWDSLFNEGSKILFRVALTLIMHNRTKFLECKNFAHITDLFKTMTCDNYVIDCHKFMQDLFSLPGSMSSKMITDLRSKNQAQ